MTAGSITYLTLTGSLKRKKAAHQRNSGIAFPVRGYLYEIPAYTLKCSYGFDVSRK